MGKKRLKYNLLLLLRWCWVGWISVPIFPIENFKTAWQFGIWQGLICSGHKMMSSFCLQSATYSLFVIICVPGWIAWSFLLLVEVVPRTLHHCGCRDPGRFQHKGNNSLPFTLMGSTGKKTPQGRYTFTLTIPKEAVRVPKRVSFCFVASGIFCIFSSRSAL